MKLDRNINPDGRGKYALVLMRRLHGLAEYQTDLKVPKGITNAIRTLENAGLIDWGSEGTPSEFFVIRPKDQYANAALRAYADAARQDDPEWALEVETLAIRSGANHRDCKRPD